MPVKAVQSINQRPISKIARAISHFLAGEYDKIEDADEDGEMETLDQIAKRR